MTRKTTPANDPTLVEPVRQALVAAMEVRVRRAKTAPLDEVSGLLMEISEIALTSRRTLATVQGQPVPLFDLKTHSSGLEAVEPEPVQAFGLSGMLTGISETVGTEVFQEFLALARAWLQKNKPLAPLAEAGGFFPRSVPVVGFINDDDDLDLEALSVRAKNLCRMEGFTAKTQIRVRSDEVLLAATKRHSATGRNQPRIVKELREASKLPEAPAPDDGRTKLVFGNDPAARRAQKVADRAGWWLKDDIRMLDDQAIRHEFIRQVVTGISRKKVLEALRAAAK